jgi:hypothetical protein
MALARPCLDCGVLVRGRSRCPTHERQHDRARGTRQQRGYDAAHDALRAQLVATYHPADPCPRCRQPLGGEVARLDLMHNEDRSDWLGLGHASCNRATVSPKGPAARTPRPPNFSTHSAPPDDPGPATA